MSATDKTKNYDLPIYKEDDITSWLNDFNGLATKLDTLIKTIDSKIPSNDKIKKIESDIKSIQTTLTTANGKITALETKVQTLESSINSFNGKFTNVVFFDSTNGKGIKANEYDKLKIGE